jgi:hypothetical protein
MSVIVIAVRCQDLRGQAQNKEDEPWLPPSPLYHGLQFAKGVDPASDGVQEVYNKATTSIAGCLAGLLNSRRGPPPPLLPSELEPVKSETR